MHEDRRTRPSRSLPPTARAKSTHAKVGGRPRSPLISNPRRPTFSSDTEKSHVAPKAYDNSSAATPGLRAHHVAHAVIGSAGPALPMGRNATPAFGATTIVGRIGQQLPHLARQILKHRINIVPAMVLPITQGPPRNRKHPTHGIERPAPRAPRIPGIPTASGNPTRQFATTR